MNFRVRGKRALTGREIDGGIRETSSAACIRKEMKRLIFQAFAVKHLEHDTRNNTNLNL